jgi:hypothetical protein
VKPYKLRLLTVDGVEAGLPLLLDGGTRLLAAGIFEYPFLLRRFPNFIERSDRSLSIDRRFRDRSDRCQFADDLPLNGDAFLSGSVEFGEDAAHHLVLRLAVVLVNEWARHTRSNEHVAKGFLVPKSRAAGSNDGLLQCP